MTTYTVTLPLDEEETKFAVFKIRPMGYDLWNSSQKFIKAEKYAEACTMVFNDLWIDGDPVPNFRDNFPAFQVAFRTLSDMYVPKAGGLKKNSSDTPSQ